MSIKALREQRQELAKQAKHQLAENGDKVWSKDDKAKFDGIADQIDAIDAQLETMQRLLDEEVERNFSDVQKKEGGKVDPARAAFEKMMRFGEKALNVEESLAIRNTMSTTTTTEGGYTVQSDVAQNLIDKLKGYKGMREVAANITTAQGNALSYPTSDGTSETGEWIAENTAATDADVVFGTVPLNVFKASSKIITVPFELLQDSSINVVELVNNRIRDRLGRVMNTGFTTGGGSTDPKGVITASSVGKTGTTGQVATIIYADIVDMVDSVDYAYQVGSLKWMMSQSMRKVIRKLADTAGRPIWTPSYDKGISGSFVDELLGYPIQLNNDVAVPAASAKSLAFGDFGKYMIRDAMQVTLFRFEDSAYAKKGQVAFMAWARAGGNLLDTAAVKLYQHPAS